MVPWPVMTTTGTILGPSPVDWGSGHEESQRPPVPSTYSVRFVNIEVRAGPMDDGRHAHPHPHRHPPRGPGPARPGAREPRAAPSAGRPPTDRAASTPAPLRPGVLGPARSSVARLGGG